VVKVLIVIGLLAISEFSCLVGYRETSLPGVSPRFHKFVVFFPGKSSVFPRLVRQP